MEDLFCPHCGVRLITVETPPLSKWGGVELDICLNDFCDYFAHSWKCLSEQAGTWLGYRYFHAENGQEGPIAVNSVDTFKTFILTEEEKRSRKEREYKREQEFRNLLSAIELAEEKKDIQLLEWLKELKKLKYPNRI
jgi:hypothetical protein